MTIQTLYAAELQRDVPHEELQRVAPGRRPSQLRRNLLTLVYAVTGLWTIALGYAAYLLLG
jgi:hypothetical protein